MKLQLVAAVCAVTFGATSAVSGCSSSGGPPAAKSTSTSSTTSTTTPPPDPHAAGVHACKVFEAAWAPVANAEYAVYNDMKNQAPPDDTKADMKKIISEGQDSATKVQAVLTPAVPNPPAGALRAWVDALGTEINSDPDAAPPNDFATNQDNEQKAALAADGICKAFS